MRSSIDTGVEKKVEKKWRLLDSRSTVLEYMYITRTRVRVVVVQVLYLATVAISTVVLLAS
jgi:hypothetical protein